MRIAVNGAGIAGPTLAYWLHRYGHEVLLVEAAPRLRTGGYVVDFWGVGYDVAEKMGLLPRINELGYRVQEVRFVDRRGRRSGGFDTGVFQRLTDGRFTSIERSELAGAIYGALGPGVATLFGDSIASIEETGGTLRIGFDHAPPREVDLVVGADGLHSRVRELVFGEVPGAVISLGYHVAAFEVVGYRPRDDLVYVSHAAPGRQVSRLSMRADRTLFLFVFRDEYLGGHAVADDGERKSALARVYADLGWESERILAALQAAPSLYFDRVSQVRLERWTKGRTALVGDAASCASLLAGEGAGLAMAQAYVLAGELNACAGDHARAFARYEERLMPLLRRKQRSARKFAGTFAPRTRRGIAFRDAVTKLLRIPALADFVIGRDLRDDIALPDY